MLKKIEQELHSPQVTGVHKYCFKFDTLIRQYLTVR